MLSILSVSLTIKVKVGIPESFKVGWYPPPKKTGSSHLKGFSKFSLPQYVKQDLVLFSMPINKQKKRKKDPTLLKVTMMYI